MEVTKSNFSEVLPKIKEAIHNADFIAIDCELTGLNTGLDINAYDTQRQYYDKVRKGAKNFLIIQYGLCIFRYDKIKKVFKQQGYNFYIFPRPTNRYVPDHRFLCQASSIDFLITKGFDFNKLFKEGIPYLNTEEEDKYKKLLAEKQKVRANQLQNSFSPQNDKSNNISMTHEEKVYVDNIRKQIEVFIDGDEEEMVLPRCNAYMRRLVYQETQKTIENRVSLETRQFEKERLLVVTKMKSKRDREKEELKKIENEEKEFNDCVGFSEIIKCIVDSGKLVIGHNMCLDMLHTVDKFLTPLPEDYDEFKELVNYSFSNILDTKYMSNTEPFRELIDSSVLSHLFKTVTEKPFNIPPIDIEEESEGYKLDSNKEHEAGFDAYITAISFLAMWKHLGDAKKSSDPFINFSLLEPYKNRLFLMRLQDAPFIKLGGKDPSPSREHVLYIKFPKEWKLSDILQLFSPFGNVHVAWINDHSAYVGLQKKEQTAIALSTLSQSDTYTVISYAKRQAQLAGQTFPSSSPLFSSKRKRSFENLNVTKKRSASFGETSAAKKKRSIDPIEEDPEELPQIKKKSSIDVGVPIQRLETGNKLKTKSALYKAFQEDSNWE
ncbi:hypothetical protein ILUMI_08056 [Ignelater luminosus]|uniref:Poly(A)-specific ribonuclease RNA-binding domain-containing protein n=1 Tax=Ignelater luminosus TaxID=2038154 RepID=A0A8K0D550_IGNLU|nr:hypothetical protein ILUMI_08056 [Ignelater luminosus]